MQALIITTTATRNFNKCKTLLTIPLQKNQTTIVKRTFFSKLFGSKKDGELNKKKPMTLGNALKSGKVEKLQQAFGWSSLKGNDDIKTAIYSIGVNNQGQLGLGDWRSESTLTFNEQFQEYSVKSLSSTLLHSSALTHDNDMLTWGANFNLQIGHKYGSNTSIFPNFIESSPYSVRVTNFPKSEIVGSSIGGWSSFAITQDPISKQQSIYAWGNNQHGQLGIGTLLNVQTPNKVILKDDGNVNNQMGKNDGISCNSNNIKKISSGLYHSLFLFKNGKILSCGKSTDGQLGIKFNENNNSSSSSPDIKIPLPTNLLDKLNIVDISAGYFHSIALDSVGDVYQWGKGRLSYKDSDDLQLSPFSQKNDIQEISNSDRNKLIKINGIPKDEIIIQIGAADNLSMALTNTGKLYKWSTTSIINKSDDDDDNDVNITAEIINFKEFNSEKISKFNLSNTHAAVIFDSTPNDICIWSLRDEFTLEKKHSKSMFATILPSNTTIKRFTLPNDHKINDMSMGPHYLILLANHNKV